ncbi:MAG: hypothetical protein ACI8TX_002512 [Hyphomicrobiaceae bacterium]
MFLVGVESLKNGGDGFNLQGTGGRALDLVGRDNAGNGISITGNGKIVSGVVANNGRPNLHDSGSDNDTSGLIEK